MTKHRDLTFDIGKALCIILMVVGHSGCPDYLNTSIYMFHMPCFFFMSGWLLSQRYIDDIKLGLKQKVKGIYWPFVKWTLIFVLLHNLFSVMHIYSNSYSLNTFLERMVRAFTMTGSEPLLGGFWFLISLFWASVFSLLYYRLLLKSVKLTIIYISGGVIFSLVASASLQYLPFRIPQQFTEQTMLATAFYMTGFLFKKYLQHAIQNRIAWLLLSIPLFAALFFRWSMQLKGALVFPYYIVAVSGTLGLLSLSFVLKKCPIRNILSYIGSKTLYILIFHFLAFRLVSYVYLSVNHLPMYYLQQSPVLRDTNQWLWLVYSIVGISFPLIVWELIHIRLKKQ